MDAGACDCRLYDRAHVRSSDSISTFDAITCVPTRDPPRQVVFTGEAYGQPTATMPESRNANIKGVLTFDEARLVPGSL